MILETVTTVASWNEEKNLIAELRKYKLFACAQSKEIQSTYFWKGKWITENEIEITFKHSVNSKEKLLTYLKKFHPYDLPQILTYEVSSTAEYEKWVEETIQEQ
ncbi:MAG: divalent-cation tolerance protein CutA [Methanobacteriota archaeon]|nr:MAG: divalent-cation tolerance protein CutA [Euryarchaeota archaeon]